MARAGLARNRLDRRRTRAGAWGGLPGERVETEAGQAVRTTERFPAAEDPREITRLAGTQYVWRVPGDDARLLMGVHTISGAGDPDLEPVVEALQELSDLILETMRWDERDAGAADSRRAGDRDARGAAAMSLFIDYDADRWLYVPNAFPWESFADDEQWADAVSRAFAEGPTPAPEGLSSWLRAYLLGAVRGNVAGAIRFAHLPTIDAPTTIVDVHDMETDPALSLSDLTQQDAPRAIRPAEVEPFASQGLGEGVKATRYVAERARRRRARHALGVAHGGPRHRHAHRAPRISPWPRRSTRCSTSSPGRSGSQTTRPEAQAADPASSGSGIEAPLPSVQQNVAR